MRELKEKLLGFLDLIFSHRYFQSVLYLEGMPYWISSSVVGVVAVIYSGLFSNTNQLAVWFCKHFPIFFMALSPFLFVLSVWVVERFAPRAGGTGMPHVITALSLDSKQLPEIESILNLKVAMVIVASSLLALLGGSALGREGPVIHISACLFYIIGKKLKKTGVNDDHRSWIVAGGAAGIAAAFNAPLAGVVFVLEELSGVHFQKFKSFVIASAIIGGIVSELLSGRYLLLGYPKIGDVTISSLPWAIVLGVIAALFALPFHQMLKPQFQNKFSKYVNTKYKFAFVSGIIVSLIAVFASHESIGGGISLMESLLFDANKRASWTTIFSRFVATIVSHLSGCSGGFLAPSLALGAAIGSKFSELIQYSNHNLLVMVGMSAFLSAIVKAPFTAWVIVMEITDRHSAIFPLMVASLVSFNTIRALERWWSHRNGR